MKVATVSVAGDCLSQHGVLEIYQKPSLKSGVKNATSGRKKSPTNASRKRWEVHRMMDHFESIRILQLGILLFSWMARCQSLSHRVLFNFVPFSVYSISSSTSISTVFKWPVGWNHLISVDRITFQGFNHVRSCSISSQFRSFSTRMIKLSFQWPNFTDLETFLNVRLDVVSPNFDWFSSVF